VTGGRIVVVGSCNLDLVTEVDRLPEAGETVMGRRHFTNPGGKGANQAVAGERGDRPGRTPRRHRPGHTTCGAGGAVIVDAGTTTRVAAPPVDAVDATAAGDAFCGMLAHGLTHGRPLAEAVHWACAAGSLTATRAGAQAALPTLEDVRDALA
jgi:sugar/nucleoside kinase (ribokinase family)